MSISNEDEFDDEIDIRVLFADSGSVELRQVPLNLGNRFHLLYELTETGHSLTIAGLPGDSTESQVTLLDEVQGFIRETLEDEQFVGALRGRNND